ncbi:MAG TPA: oxygenase MpaB family protein [Aeromicrobium sp.]|nr:oxygenase MpaB family protein [Aeromicrobium sp.]
MTITTDLPDDLVDVLPPGRFRAGEQRAASIGKILKVIGRIDRVDEDLMELIGRRFMVVDELGGRLAEAIRSKGPGSVSMKQFRQALACGVDSVPDAPPALREFFEHLERTPDWVDMDLVNEGARVYRRLGRNASDVLLQLALIGGYRFGGPTDLLVATGALAGASSQRRLGETQKWGIAISQHDAMRRDGQGWQLTVHVRLMHALVNSRFSDPGMWDSAYWGRPINASDQAATLGLFDGALLLGARALGVRITKHESLAVMHLWKYIGWLIGVEDDWLVDTERERHRLNYHILLAQDEVTPAGQELSNSIVDAQRTLHFSGPFTRLQALYARERLLSMLRPFLGRKGLDDLDLPVRPPWATALVMPKNIVKYWIVGRTAWGERYLQWSARRNSDQLMRRYFGDDQPELARLT